jgi:Ni/Co efflux regulator RcnB
MRMKRALIIAAALGLLLPDVSMAQSNQQNQQPPRPPPGAPGKPPGGQPNRPPGGQPNRPPGGQPNRPPGGQPNRPPPQHGQPNRPPPGQPNRPPPPRPMPQPGRPAYRPPPTYIRPLPPRGNQFWHRDRYYGRIQGPAFVYPPGWRYRQWTIGQRLPPLFLGPSYAYAGWGALGLQAPAPGYIWVRFGPDLLLVNQNTNEVEDVVYGVFL